MSGVVAEALAVVHELASTARPATRCANPFALVVDAGHGLRHRPAVAGLAVDSEDSVVDVDHRDRRPEGVLVVPDVDEDLVGVGSGQSVGAASAVPHRDSWPAEITVARQPTIDTDICLPVDAVAVFFERIHARLPSLDPGAETLSVAHLGDGNIHFTVFSSNDTAALYDAVVEAVEDEVQVLGGSFSAEHGVGLSKLASMRRRKDPVALAVMRSVKAALDPEGRMNPGKVIPE